MLKKIIQKIKGRLGIPVQQGSETAKVRHLVLPWCKGLGADVGFGGDKIQKENCLGIDYAQPYVYAGKDKVDIAVDLYKELIPLPDNYFDYIYSSHLIEDFEDTKHILKEFIRLIKPGGNLILVFPDQPKFEEHCRRTGQPLNPHHVHEDMGFAYMQNQMEQIPVEKKLLFKSDCEIDYNVIMVYAIIKNQ